LDPTKKLAWAYRTILLLAAIVVGLVLLCASLTKVDWIGSPRENQAVFDPELRRAALQELVDRGSGVWDAFPDPTVARLLQPGIRGRPLEGVTIDSNELGLRERSFALPKPAGTTRVVLLGDSFVMGYGVHAEDRAGVFLEKLLADHAQAAHGPIECLHFGINTWNVVSECAFLRRQLALVKPDLVVQVVVRNDLDDNPGARGMGAMAQWWPRHPERADAFVFEESPHYAFATRENNWLLFGLDWESRSRLDESGREVGRLARAVEAAGGRYLLFNSYSGRLELGQRFFAKELAPAQSVVFPSSFNKLERFRNSRTDAHWNRAGHEQVALFLYGVLRERGLLPGLALQPLPAADEVVKRLLPEAEEEVRKPATLKKLLERRTIGSEIDFGRIDDDAAAQVHAGVVRGGFVSAYASMILRAEGRARLTIAGHGLPRPEIDGVKVAVFVDALQVGTIEPRAAAPFKISFDVPAELAAQPFVSVRFQADDFAYSLPDLRACQVFVLERVALTK